MLQRPSGSINYNISYYSTTSMDPGSITSEVSTGTTFSRVLMQQRYRPANTSQIPHCNSMKRDVPSSDKPCPAYGLQYSISQQ